jgi:hypothetical protein
MPSRYYRVGFDPEAWSRWFPGEPATEDAERDERARRLREAERPIVDDLKRAGVSVSSVRDLVNTSVPYPDALPILLAHLKRGGYPERVMESLGPR